MFDANEKQYLRDLVKRELEEFRKVEKMPGNVAFLKAEHEYDHFLERLLEKLK